jgi:hypothetical protein
MAIELGYPVTLVHPQHRAATIATGNMTSVPEQFPPVTVNGAIHEAEYRAKGYLRYGEAQPVMKDHHEYPKMMRHPEFEAEVPARIEARIEDGRIRGTFTIPSVPAKFPDVRVEDETGEELWREKGYAPAGEYNRDALESVLNGTIDEETYDPAQYPKWENGKLVSQDPDSPDMTPSPDYPRWENGVLITDPRFAPVPDPHEFPKWIHKDGKPSEASQLANTPAEEFAIRAKWKPVEEEIKEETIVESVKETKPVAPKLKVAS